MGNFLLNLLHGAYVSAILSIIFYPFIRGTLRKNYQEESILDFYQHDLKSYKKLESFFQVKELLSKSFIVYLLISIFYLTFAYFIGLLIYDGVLLLFSAMDNSVNIPDAREFVPLAYILGMILYLYKPYRIHKKSKELIEHYYKVN